MLGCIEKGIQLVLVAGGMSGDPDDVRRVAINDAGATDLVYGSPVLPGAMFLYAQVKGVPVMGLPACVLYYKATVFDLMLPRVLAGERIKERQEKEKDPYNRLVLEFKMTTLEAWLQWLIKEATPFMERKNTNHCLS